MTTLTIISELKNKANNNIKFTALDNQLAKLTMDEMNLYAKLNNKGIEGEEALEFVFKASLVDLV